MSFASVYPHYINKVEKKGRTKEEVDAIICWLTGFSQKSLQQIDTQEEKKVNPEKIKVTLQSLIEKEIENIKNGKSNRLHNADKIRLFEFRIRTENFEEILRILNKISKAEWIDEHWRDKYTPNIFGIEVAFFRLNEHQIIVQREKDIIDGKLVYFFEMDEPLESIENKNMAEKMKKLFKIEKVKYNFRDYGIMENDFEE